MPDAIDDVVGKCLGGLGFKEHSRYKRSITGSFTDEYEYPKNTDNVKLTRREGRSHTGDLTRAVIFEKDGVEAELDYYILGGGYASWITGYKCKKGNSKLKDLKAKIRDNLPQSPQDTSQRKNSSALPQLPVEEVIKIMYNTLLGYNCPAKDSGQPNYPI